MQKVHSLKAKLHDHKRLFKDVMGKLVKKVKTLEVKLKTKKRKMVVSDSDQEDGNTQDVDLDALRVFDISPGASNAHTGASIVPSGTFAIPAAASAVPADSPNVPADSLNAPAGVSSKGKSLMVEEDIPVKARTFKQMEEDRLGEEAAKRLHDEEMAQMERERAEAAQVKANGSLSKTLLGDDVSEDNFPARMAELIKKNRQALAEQLFKEIWTMAYVKSFTDEQLKQEFEKIRKVQSHSQIQAFSQTLKRPGHVLEEPSSKRPKSPEASTPSILESFINVAVDEDSDDEVLPAWSAVVGWEVLPTPLGSCEAIWLSGGKGSCVWKHQNLWEIRSWRLYTLSNVYVLETVSGEVLSMFTDVSYPLSVKLMERMLMHKLEIDSDIAGNDMTTTEQLI
nr:JmjC domain-containing protein [Tanacetum cinerariifolium]